MMGKMTPEAWSMWNKMVKHLLEKERRVH